MKTLLSNQKYTWIFALFLSLSVWAGNGDWKGKITREKVIEKSFKVQPNVLMKVSNQYGIVQVNSWNQSEVRIKVQIRVNADKEKDLQKYLDEIQAHITSSSDMITAKTKYPYRIKGSSEISFEVNYVIMMPVNGRLKVENQYGDIHIDKLNGETSIDVEYGNLSIGELWNDRNQIWMQYSTQSNINFIKKGTIQASYSDLKIKKGTDLKLDGSYTQFGIGEVETMDLSTTYGGMDAQKVGSVKGEVEYLDLQIDEITSSVNLELSFGGLRINKVKETTKSVIIEGDYTSIRVEYDPKWEFQFDVDTSFAKMQSEDDMVFETKDSGAFSGEYKGYHKNPQSKNKLKIDSNFGGVRVMKSF